ncbi:GNAT family N-acetyltransferase [Actinophytocola sp. NPDC049390]|uniref:GNAT family N-acetyltransferase n=1 Tax=Actinophytocola sp. NPDC049390 TaxID=3363894 RepID=UPI0037954927
MTHVRPMRIDERDAVRSLLTDAYRPYANDLTPAMHEYYLAGVLDLDDGGDAIVAMAGDKVVGTARLFPPDRAPVPLPAGWAWVRAVAVHPSAQGTGAGRALMAYCATRTTGALALHTMDFMPSAVRLYERLGYERVPEWDIQVGMESGFPAEEQFLAIAYALVR